MSTKAQDMSNPMIVAYNINCEEDSKLNAIIVAMQINGMVNKSVTIYIEDATFVPCFTHKVAIDASKLCTQVAETMEKIHDSKFSYVGQSDTVSIDYIIPGAWEAAVSVFKEPTTSKLSACSDLVATVDFNGKKDPTIMEWVIGGGEHIKRTFKEAMENTAKIIKKGKDAPAV